MSVAIDPSSLAKFRSFVAERMGLEFPDDKIDDLAEVLRVRLSATGLPGCEAYLRHLSAPASGPGEIREVAHHLTVNETYFFRNPNQFRALVEVVLPARIAIPERTGGLSVLSAGCASGEEAYTVAMLLREHQGMAVHLPAPSILGIDVNSAVLEKARRGRYTEWSLRATPPWARSRWFHGDGKELVLDESIRSMATFEPGNLAQDATGSARPGSLDVVFCRNVFIYFSPEAIRAAVEHFARALQPEGFLFLGDAESLRGISNDFELCHTHETFYYRLRSERQRRAPMPPVRSSSTTSSAPPPEQAADGAWMDAIGRASRRVASLTDGRTRPRPGRAGPEARPGWDLSGIRKLIDGDREAEALAALATLPREALEDPEMKLVFAALLTNRGDLTAAERACRELLGLDEFNAGAHYVLALVCEQRAALADAREHDRIAAYLDPEFAMPHLHLGRLARRAGDVQRARQELTRALELIDTEDPSRLALFAGGFSREGLRQICRTELGACGGER